MSKYGLIDLFNKYIRLSTKNEGWITDIEKNMFSLCLCSKILFQVFFSLWNNFKMPKKSRISPWMLLKWNQCSLTQIFESNFRLKIRFFWTIFVKKKFSPLVQQLISGNFCTTKNLTSIVLCFSCSIFFN